jgi:hypothetical protein
MKVTIFKNITDTNNPHYVTIDKIVERIKSGNSRELVNKIRGGWTKEQRNEYKKQLPSICFSGIFEKRANNSIKEHSGLVCLDFDHIDDVEKFKERFKKDKHVLMAFVSPSGDGLKVVIKIPANIQTHADSCRALKQYFHDDKLDDFKDVARVCYESYDKDIYYNPDSEIYKVLIKDDNNVNRDIFEKLKKWVDKEIDYSDGQKYKYLVKFAGALNRFGISRIDAEHMLISEYQYKASFVKSEDFHKIINKVYNSYPGQNGTAVFEKNGKAFVTNSAQEIKPDFIKEYEPEIIDKREKDDRLHKLLEGSYIDLSLPPKKPPTILSIRNEFDFREVRFFTLGNTSVIKGKPKSKKTFAKSILAPTLASNTEIFRNIVPTMLTGKEQVIDFDTEQGRWDAWNVANRIDKIGRGVPMYGCHSLRGVGAKDLIDLIEYSLRNVYGNAGIIFIDQGADLVESVNSEEEAVFIAKWQEMITAKYNIHICNIIHENKHDNFAQGWLGTQLMKKTENIIEVKKDDQNKRVSHVEPFDTRGGDFEPFSFWINDESLPELLNSDDRKEMLNEEI